MIPALINGVLPEGTHLCTIEEVAEKFGSFQRSDRRIRLAAKLREFEDQARKSGIVAAIIINGSFVTAKDEPNDIDLIIALPTDFDLTSELRPFKYNILSKPMIRQHSVSTFALPLTGVTFTSRPFNSFVRFAWKTRNKPGIHRTKGF